MTVMSDPGYPGYTPGYTDALRFVTNGLLPRLATTVAHDCVFDDEKAEAPL